MEKWCEIGTTNIDCDCIRLLKECRCGDWSSYHIVLRKYLLNEYRCGDWSRKPYDFKEIPTLLPLSKGLFVKRMRNIPMLSRDLLAKENQMIDKDVN